MKKQYKLKLELLLLVGLLFSTALVQAQNLIVGGNVGIGTSTPAQKLHVFKGSAGAVTANANSISIFETDGPGGFISILAPAGIPRGILFGEPGNNAAGGILYDNPTVADGLDFRTNGNITRMLIDGNGNVGIGTSNPTQKLDVEGNARITGKLELINTEDDSSIFIGEEAGRDDNGNNTNVFIGGLAGSLNISGQGNTFIGPQAGLNNTTGFFNTVMGAFSGTSTVTGTRNTYLGSIAGQVNADSLDRAIAIGYFAKVNCSKCAVIGGTEENAVSVGIGTSTPLTKLSVTPDSTGAKITLYDNANANNHAGFGVSSGQLNYHSFLTDDHVFYAGGKNGNGTELMRIRGNGNTGIGTGNPTERLEVNGNIKAAQFIGDGSMLTGVGGGSWTTSGDNIYRNIGNVGLGTENPLTQLSITPDTAGAKITLFDNANTDNHAGFGVSSGQLNYHSFITDDHVFYAGGKNGDGTELMRIDGNGDLSIGATTGLVIPKDGRSNFGDVPNYNFNTANTNSNPGMLLEYKHSASSETSGFYSDSDYAVIFSPGDLDRLLRIQDEDLFNNFSEKFYIDANGNDFEQSDIRRKKNIEVITDALDKVLKMRGVEYDWKVSDKESRKREHQSHRTIGVIAQEVEKIVPNLVRTNEYGSKFVDYGGLGPVLIEAIKEQQTQISERDDRIRDLERTNREQEGRLQKLESLVADLIAGQAGDSMQKTTLTDARLEQNQPNPFNGATTVRYFIPEGIADAELRITNAAGKVIKRVAIDVRGEGQSTFDATTLGSGMYQYSLFLDGKLVDTKQMVLTRN